MKFIYIFFCLCLLTGWGGTATFAQQVYKSVQNGRTWLANDGKHINAHGGGMFYENGYYYLFGESRNGMNSNGVGVYRSTDLYNWENLGLALELSGKKTNTLQDIAKGRLLERPKVIYNERTKKYVMWAHWEDGNDYSKARAMVAVADKVEGPYTFVRTVRPNGQMSRDQTIFVEDGKAYQIRASEENMTLHCTLLDEEYCKPTDTWQRIIVGKQYEAPAIMRVGDLYFGIFSGCTGWDPNPAHLSMTKDFMSSNWTDLGNPCLDENSGTTYSSQSTHIFKVEGYENAYVFMADRWNKNNVEASTYVWLPVRLRTGYPILNWFDTWDLSVFEDMYRFKRAKDVKAGNVYALLARLSDRLVSDVDGSLCLYNDDDNCNLQFVFEETDQTGIYKLRDTGSGNYLDASGNSLVLNPISSSVSQQWEFQRQSDKFFVIVNRKTGTCLTVKDGNTANRAQLVLGTKMAALKTKFGVYFDTKQFDYEVDDFFARTDTPSGLADMEPDDSSQVYAYQEGACYVLQLNDIFINEMLRIAVYNRAGMMICERGFYATEYRIALDMPLNLSEGIYYVAVSCSKAKATARLVVRN
ncbi:RICIN domain-containing protein [Bacteroides sp.]